MDASESWVRGETYPVRVELSAATTGRDRLTGAFRFVMAIPHMILVGGPVGVMLSLDLSTEHALNLGWGAGGLLSAVACVVSVFAWFAILFTGRHPQGLYDLAAYYLRWRVRAIAYMTLLRDEYPPFGDGAYPAELHLTPPAGERDRVSVLFRIVFALPHIMALWILSVGWAFSTAIAWAAIVLTGRYPETLYGFAIGMLAWSMRVEAYVLLLTDEYPPFTLRA